MAGARDHEGGGWLVEVYTDEISSPVLDLAPTLFERSSPWPWRTGDRGGRPAGQSRPAGSLARRRPLGGRGGPHRGRRGAVRLRRRCRLREPVWSPSAGSSAPWSTPAPSPTGRRRSLSTRPIGWPTSRCWARAMVEDVAPWTLSASDPDGSPVGSRPAGGHGTAQRAGRAGPPRGRRLGRRAFFRQPRRSGGALNPHPTTSTSAWRSPAWSRRAWARSSTTRGSGGWRTPTR